jgi:hypothetical protein
MTKKPKGRIAERRAPASGCPEGNLEILARGILCN